MASPDAALATQLANIEKRTGKTLVDFAKIIKASGLTKHGQIRDMLKADCGMGHGDANTVTHLVFAAEKPAETRSDDEVVDGLYSGAKAALRPIHDQLMKELSKLGEFEIAPKKTYLSLRRKKQFAMVGPATNTRVEVGINWKAGISTARLEAMPPKGMCDFKVKLTEAGQVDAELIQWIREAYNAAG